MTLNLNRSIYHGKRKPALDSRLRTMMTKAVHDSGLSHAEIARRAGLDRTTVSSIMNGRRSGLVDTWDLILIAAGVELGYRINKEE